MFGDVPTAGPGVATVRVIEIGLRCFEGDRSFEMFRMDRVTCESHIPAGDIMRCPNYSEAFIDNEWHFRKIASIEGNLKTTMSTSV
jgi:hypothetical protein